MGVAFSFGSKLTIWWSLVQLFSLGSALVQPPASSVSSFVMVVYYACLKTHHLLDHKPDNLLRTGHKHGLTGLYRFGTPGIAIAWAAGDDDSGLHNFMDKLQSAMPQKKFAWIIWREVDEDIATARVAKQWTEMTSASELKDAMAGMTGVDEDDYYTVLGIEKRETPASDETIGAKKGKKSKQKSGKKK